MNALADESARISRVQKKKKYTRDIAPSYGRVRQYYTRLAISRSPRGNDINPPENLVGITAQTLYHQREVTMGFQWNPSALAATLIHDVFAAKRIPVICFWRFVYPCIWSLRFVGLLISQQFQYWHISGMTTSTTKACYDNWTTIGSSTTTKMWNHEMIQPKEYAYLPINQ